jgi:hypothetical protein
MMGAANEDECAVCGSWPATLRPSMRTAIYGLPLKKPICEGCVDVFWQNCIEPLIKAELKSKPKR